MRDILFRGKSVVGDWVEGNLLLSKDKNAFIVNQYGYEVIPETVGQYTGLTDENGKKIFEGDIVKCIFISPYQESEFVSEVVFLDGSWFVHESEDCDVYLYSYEIEGAGSLSEIKVIGNIHDNPELMKGGEIE